MPLGVDYLFWQPGALSTCEHLHVDPGHFRPDSSRSTRRAVCWHYYQFAALGIAGKMGAIRIPMKRVQTLLIATITCVAFFACTVNAQSNESPPFRRLTSNAGFSVSVPVSTAATYITPGWGFIYGAGYNLNKHHAFFGEVTWNQLYATDRALEPIRVAAQNTAINGRGNLFVLTANYRIQFEGHALGLYFLGGGGMYYRDASLSQRVATGSSTIACNEVWLWWGFTCSAGVVTQNQTLAHTNSVAPGGNVGIGITVRIPDFPYKFYVETRYHYAANTIVNTQLIPVTVGLRF